MDLGTGLAIFSAADDASSLLIEIGKKVNEVRKFKPQCKILHQDASKLLAVYEKNKDALEGLNMAGDVKECLEAIDSFVTSCLKWNTIDVGLEVIIHRRLPALREKARRLVDLFTFELAVENFARQRAGFADVVARLPEPSPEHRISTQAQAVVRAHMEEEQRIVKGQAPVPSTLAIASIKPDFDSNDARLAITFVEQTDALGRKSVVGRGTLEGRGKVVCAKVEVDKYTHGYLKVYRNLQIGAGVQICFGTWASGDGLYAIMEDLSGLPTLHDLCSGKRPKLTPLDKYGMAYNLGQSITSLHGGEICLKFLDDHSVVLKDRGDGKWTPILTGLEQSRLMSERTTREGHDCRYEAVEYQNTWEHFQSTDIWSFGILIWQLIYEKFPFDLPTAVALKDAAAKEIRKKLRDGHKPGTLPPSSADGDVSERAINRLIASCWAPRPDIRPTAKDLTRDLQIIYLQSSFQITLCVHGSSTADAPLKEAEADRLRADLAERIKQARDLNPPGTGRPVFIPAGLLVEERDFLAFWGASDLGWDSVSSYIVGALAFWGMLKQERKVLSEILGPDAVVADLQEARYNFALKHLLSAAEGGYKEAYHEIWRTQAALAKLYKARYELWTS